MEKKLTYLEKSKEIRKMGGRKRGESGNPERDKHVVDGDGVPGIWEGRRIVKTLRFFQRRLTKAQSYESLYPGGLSYVGSTEFCTEIQYF